jgi:hypothetical protein
LRWNIPLQQFAQDHRGFLKQSFEFRGGYPIDVLGGVEKFDNKFDPPRMKYRHCVPSHAKSWRCIIAALGSKSHPMVIQPVDGEWLFNAPLGRKRHHSPSFFMKGNDFYKDCNGGERTFPLAGR